MELLEDVLWRWFEEVLPTQEIVVASQVVWVQEVEVVVPLGPLVPGSRAAHDLARAAVHHVPSRASLLVAVPAPPPESPSVDRWYDGPHVGQPTPPLLHQRRHSGFLCVP